MSSHIIAPETMTSPNSGLETVKLNNEVFFKISDFDSIRPFFMSIVSDSNHWMFISSNGGVSAGRKNAEFSLFPYYTDDKLTELAHTTGSKTILQVHANEGVEVWEPFCEKNAIRHSISRNLYKNKFGNKILFEEINHDLELTFKYEWNSSDRFGFVKKSSLVNNDVSTTSVKILDGIQNILPASVVSDLQNRSSNLLDAYKRSELVKETGLGVYALSAIPVDKAEPSEALKANIAWSYGIDNPTYLLSSLQLDKFRSLKPVSEEFDIKGDKGAYFIVTDLSPEAHETIEWFTVANVNQNHAQVIELNHQIKTSTSLATEVFEDVEQGTKNLLQLIAGADGLQTSEDSIKDARHYSNVLFNIMRGGTFDYNYQIEKWDFEKYLLNASKPVYDRNTEFLSKLDSEFDKLALDSLLDESTDADLLRLGKEYLPLKFSRRHGDPSRPWNKFTINTTNELDGSKILDYEGNWRDIFQNWEALVHSYPDFIEGMIFKFLNATTFDGYNPYRVTKGGFDWETIEPDDPWSYIGYWGDHQIIYLLKFLEFYQNQDEEALRNLFDQDLFVYANVPYRIKPYGDIVNNPKDTIDFNDPADHEIQEKLEAVGADGALLSSGTSDIHHVNFVEKILATVLSKVSNFIPEAGIWMNTQRPEWNDANNALVGNGVSMVTLYYLRRFLNFLHPVLSEAGDAEVSVSEEVHQLFTSISTVLTHRSSLLGAAISDEDRKVITDSLGIAGSNFRESVYDNGFSGVKKSVSISEIKDFTEVTLKFLEHSTRANKRDDNLYHAYNIISFEGDSVSVSYLDEMLEGQVAVLSSGYLDAEEAVSVLDALRASTLYREDQMSYVLYPNKKLKGFLQRNNIPSELFAKSELLQKMVADGNHAIASTDVEGGYHFNGNFSNANDLKEALDGLESTDYASLATSEEGLILGIFEEIFNHKAFTGRSGTFYGYEGLGSIYWHMVSKLYLAVAEICRDAEKSGANESVLGKLANHFEEIGEGIGVHKSPKLYGAYPTDPYSHTPMQKGAQQPGMTGQVKEDILARFIELGISVNGGELTFNPSLLKLDEFTKEEQSVSLVDLEGNNYTLSVPKSAVSFTYCQVPIVYQLSENEGVQVIFNDGTTVSNDDLNIDAAITKQIQQRTGSVKEISVSVPKSRIRQT